jgi:hypothetical protein
MISENQRLVHYNDYIKKLDSALVSTIEYNEYIKNVKEYIYEMQQLTVNSKTNTNFDKVFTAIVNSLNSNAFFKREQEKDLRQLQNRELAINRALITSDSLQKTYKKVLESVNEQNSQQGAQTSITIEGNQDKKETKEFELFKNEIELRKELVAIEREKENKQFIVEIMSNTPNKGFVDLYINIFGQSISPKVFYTFLFMFTVFLVLLISRFIKFLDKYKNQV